MSQLRVDIWSDVVCPWCAIGKRRLEAALGRFARADEVDVVWRAFELDPAAPAAQADDNAARLARKYGRTREQAVRIMEQLAETAAREGLDFDLVHARSGNTFDAHRLLCLARERGLQSAVGERFFRAYMGERQPIGDREVLVRLASEAGVDAAEARATLATDRFAAEVRADEEAARALGIHGVPFFLVAPARSPRPGGVFAVSGAQPADLLLEALERAWQQLEAGGDAEAAEGSTCGPDGCA